MIVTKQTPLQPDEIRAIYHSQDINKTCQQLQLYQRPSIPLEIVRAYTTLQNPQDLMVWGQNPKNWALHRLATEANRSKIIPKQNSSWGTQYSQVVNFWLLAQPQYRKRKYLPEIKPLFHPQLYQALECWDPQLELELDWLHHLRARVIQKYLKAPNSISRPNIKNYYNLVSLNWVVLLELWVCVPELQHPNQLLELLGHRSLGPPPLFDEFIIAPTTETANDL